MTETLIDARGGETRSIPCHSSERGPHASTTRKVIERSTLLFDDKVSLFPKTSMRLITRYGQFKRKSQVTNCAITSYEVGTLIENVATPPKGLVPDL
jgi:hypothetical protein